MSQGPRCPAVGEGDGEHGTKPCSVVARWFADLGEDQGDRELCWGIGCRERGVVIPVGCRFKWWEQVG